MAGQRDALVEHAADECALAIAGATGDAHGVGLEYGAARLLDDVDDAADTPGPGGQQPGAAGGAVDAVESTLLVVARGAFLAHGQGVVADDGGPGGLDGGGVGTESSHDDHGRERPGAGGEIDPGREGGAAAVVGHVDGDAGPGDRPGDTGRFAGFSP